MCRKKTILLLLIICILFSACKTASVAQKTVVTLMELSSNSKGITIKVEYKQKQEKEETPLFVTAKATANTFSGALTKLESENHVDLYLANCTAIILENLENEQSLSNLLTQLAANSDIRPNIPLFFSKSPFISKSDTSKDSLAEYLKPLFEKNGGTLPKTHNLKDTVARVNDPLLTAIFPEISKKESSVSLDGFWFLRGSVPAFLSREDAVYLPNSSYYATKRHIPLKQSASSAEISNLFCYISTGGTIDRPVFYLTIFPIGSVLPDSGKENLKSQKQELTQELTKKTQQVLTELYSKNGVDPLSATKLFLYKNGIFEESQFQNHTGFLKNAEFHILVNTTLVN